MRLKHTCLILVIGLGLGSVSHAADLVSASSMDLLKAYHHEQLESAVEVLRGVGGLSDIIRAQGIEQRRHGRAVSFDLADDGKLFRITGNGQEASGRVSIDPRGTTTVNLGVELADERPGVDVTLRVCKASVAADYVELALAEQGGGLLMMKTSVTHRREAPAYTVSHLEGSMSKVPGGALLSHEVEVATSLMRQAAQAVPMGHPWGEFITVETGRGGEPVTFFVEHRKEVVSVSYRRPPQNQFGSKAGVGGEGPFVIDFVGGKLSKPGRHAVRTIYRPVDWSGYKRPSPRSKIPKL